MSSLARRRPVTGRTGSRGKTPAPTARRSAAERTTASSTGSAIMRQRRRLHLPPRSPSSGSSTRRTGARAPADRACAAGVGHVGVVARTARRIALTTEPPPRRTTWTRARISSSSTSTSGRQTRSLTTAAASSSTPTWLPDGRPIAVLGGCLPRQPYRTGATSGCSPPTAPTRDVEGGRNLTARHDLMPGLDDQQRHRARREAAARRLAPDGASITVPRAAPRARRAVPRRDRRWRARAADRRPALPVELDAVAATASRAIRLRRPPSCPLVADRARATSGPRDGTAASAAVEPAHDLNAGDRSPRSTLREPVERSVTVDGRRRPGLAAIPARPAPTAPAATAGPPLVTRSTAGRTPSTAGRRSSSSRCSPATACRVFFREPARLRGLRPGLQRRRTSRDWGHGPDAGRPRRVEALVADGLADPDRLGLTGGSYGGYLTNWILGHDQRFGGA